MTGKYRIEIELLLDESTATQALALARDSHPFSRSHLERRLEAYSVTSAALSSGRDRWFDR